VSQSPAALEPDLTGRDRLVWNVFAGWSGYAVMAVAGFLAPRIMDRTLGQETLGVWDFGWTLVSYFALTQVGVGSAVNRYVARYRAVGNVEGLRRVASTVAGLNAGAGAVTLLLTALSAWLLPMFIRPDLVKELHDARLLVGLLGATVACQLTFQAYHGVIAGCHRFDVQNAITATFGVATSLAIVAALLAGGGLVALGIIVLVFELATALTRYYWAHRICPELRISLSDARWDQALELLRFGLKTLLSMISALLLLQSAKLIVGSSLGLAALAVFSRPLALIRVIESFSSKLAGVLTPTASSLEKTGRQKELADMTLESTRLGVALTLPMVLVLAILGSQIMLLWMGPRYAAGLPIAVLAFGYLGPLAALPIWTILVGLNRHGRPALISLAAAVGSTLLGLLNAFLLDWGITGAALALAVPLAGEAFFVFCYAGRVLQVRFDQLWRESFAAPLACAVPLVLVLLLWRTSQPEQPLVAVLGGVVTGGLLILPLYWRFILPPALQDQVRQIPHRIHRSVRLSSER